MSKLTAKAITSTNNSNVDTLVNKVLAASPESVEQVKYQLEVGFSSGNLSQAEAELVLLQINTAYDTKLSYGEFNCFKSAQTSTAEVKTESEYFTGSNMYIAGAILGGAADQLINGVNIAAGVVSTVNAGAGYLLRDKINELCEGTVTKCAAAAAGAAVSMGAGYGTRMIQDRFFGNEESGETVVNDNQTEAPLPSALAMLKAC